MALMKALKTFRVGGSGKIVHAGSEFESSNVKDYEKRGMAVQVHAPVAVKRPARGAAKAGATVADPSGRVGGKTGTAKPASLSPAAPAPRARRSRKSKA